MTTLIETLLGRGTDLNSLQMSVRAIIVFAATFVFIRISGRRSFGLRTSLDNIIAITLGAVLSRVVVGASPILPVLSACMTIALIHRLLGWAVSKNETFAEFLEGRKIVLFHDGIFQEKNFHRALACREDVMQGVRETAQTEDLSQIKTIYMERNGIIVAVKK